MTAVDQDGIRRLAALVARHLLSGKEAPVSGDPSVLAAAVATAIVANFKTEAEIERQARKKLESLGRETDGMDHAKLLQGIRQHLAKERGFVL